MTSITARRRNAAAAKWADAVLTGKPPQVCNALRRKLSALEQKMLRGAPKTEKGE